MLRRTVLKVLAPLAWLTLAGNAAAATMVVTKNAACSCCRHWVALMQQAGFTVEVRDIDLIAPVNDRLGVPEKLHSCHVAEVGGYAIEGHVPAEDIKRLLRQRPKIAGLAVPGMIPGSPGMDHGGAKQHYDVIAFDRAGHTSVFASH